MIIDWGKLVTIVLVLVGVTLLAAIDAIDKTTVVPFYTLVVGYVFGNGRLAVRGKSSQPMIHPREVVFDPQASGADAATSLVGSAVDATAPSAPVHLGPDGR